MTAMGERTSSYFLLKVPTLIAAAALPALIIGEWSKTAAWLGVFIAAAESLQQVGQVAEQVAL